jgi:adenylate kinase
MRISLLGAPGAGKGTIAKLLMEADESILISTGDILRAAINEGTELGKEAKGYMDRGDLVPDELIIKMMEARIKQEDCWKGFIFDGFPRTIPQAEALKDLLTKFGIKLDLVVNLEVPPKVIMDRLTARRTCSNPLCQEIYNIKTNPPSPAGRCEKCGSPIVQRADETEEAILNRLVTYNKKTTPLIDYYRREGLLRTFDSLSIRETVESIKKALKT